MNFQPLVKKILLSVLAVIAVFYLVLTFSVRPLTEKAVRLALREGKKQGVDVSELDFREAYLESPNSIAWAGINGRFRFVSRGEELKNREFQISVDRIILKFKNLKQRKFGVSASGLSIRTSEAEGGKLEYIEGQDLDIKFVLDFFHPRTIPHQMRAWAKGLGDLLTSGKTVWPVEFSGTTYFAFHGKPARARLSVKKEGDEYRLVMYEQDLKDVARQFGEHVTDAEVNLTARYPLRAPKLLRISDYAAKAAAAAAKGQPELSQNCYRHVIWSYLLTKEYGADFAKQVTDAHEDGPDIEGDRDIDLRNNEVGRRFALEKIPETAVRSRLLTDKWAVLNAAYWPKVQHRKPPKPRTPKKV